MRVGVAYGAYVRSLLQRFGQLIDYVEVAHELLAHQPTVLDDLVGKPTILHCASLDIAGSARVSEGTVSAVRRSISQTATPWVGEHLAFITASRELAGENAEEYAPGEPYNLGFTVGPPMNSDTLDSVVATVAAYEKDLGLRVLLENSPIYFEMPGSTMSQVDFIQELCRRSPTRLLLDLTHFFITSQNTAADPFSNLSRYPLDRIDEVHISGTAFQEGVFWDDHASGACDEVFELLELVCRRVTPRAVTLEYNWSARFPEEVLVRDLHRVREIVGCA